MSIEKSNYFLWRVGVTPLRVGASGDQGYEEGVDTVSPYLSC